MKNYGLAPVSEFLDDFVIYRNLEPYDKRIQPLSAIRKKLGLQENFLPRKSMPEFAIVILDFLNQARSLDFSKTSINKLVCIGDTMLNDGNAFLNICEASDWKGMAFIGTENTDPAEMKCIEKNENKIYDANRWNLLADFNGICKKEDFLVDENTAIIIDLDKTALGARGRNSHVIDRARVGAVRRTVSDLLKSDFNLKEFEYAYNLLNKPEFHSFTTDNQDYLAYICLILGSGLYKLSELVLQINEKVMTSFTQFIIKVNDHVNKLSTNLQQIHNDIFKYVQQGDPTPFKMFRTNEYITTTKVMGILNGELTVDILLDSEILITQEVREVALEWKEQGALIFGLSDKPDEASIPSEKLVRDGFRPIHQVETHIVGE